MGVQTPIAPPATIGILGGGQLGRMLGMAARAMGYRVAVLDPDPDCPAAPIADLVVVGGYDDVEAALRLADASDVVTYELEHVAAAVVEAVEARVPGPAGPRAAARDPGSTGRTPVRGARAGSRWLRGARSVLWRRRGPPPRRWASRCGSSCRPAATTAAARSGSPTSRSWTAPGSASGVEAGTALLAERELEFAMELSVIVARGGDEVAVFPLGRNVHDAGVLVQTGVAAPVTLEVAAEAVSIGTRLAVAMDLQGTLTVELFLMPDDTLVVNELAPRVHNSGHWTIEGAATSQFEQHIRAICGLGLGSPAAHGPAAMVNLLGTGPRRAARLLGVAEALADPAVHLHLYDKREVFERRKMGHLTALGTTTDLALATVSEALAKLHWADDTTNAEDDR